MIGSLNRNVDSGIYTGSADETEVVANAVKAMGIALGVGAYGELGDDENETGATTMVVRLKQEGQGKEIIKDFPDVSRLCHLVQRIALLIYL